MYILTMLSTCMHDNYPGTITYNLFTRDNTCTLNLGMRLIRLVLHVQVFCDSEERSPTYTHTYTVVLKTFSIIRGLSIYKPLILTRLLTEGGVLPKFDIPRDPVSLLERLERRRLLTRGEPLGEPEQREESSSVTGVTRLVFLSLLRKTPQRTSRKPRRSRDWDSRSTEASCSASRWRRMWS